MRVFISVAEHSADMHGAALVREARQRLPQASFFGLTGPRMREAGVESIYDLTAHSAMLTGVVGMVNRARQALSAVEVAWRQRAPDVVVLLDSPALHMRLAQRAHHLGLRVLYYIAPQTWVSREGRIRRIAQYVDHLACILPFEEAYFRAHGVRATYVGHPLFESLAREQPDAAAVERLRTAGRPLVALLPGSRRHVIATMLPIQLDTLRQLRALGLPAAAAISAVSAEAEQQIAGVVHRAAADAVIVRDDNASLLTAADLVLVASGTATLHVAHYRTPMIVVYDAGAVLNTLRRLIGRRFLLMPHLSLLNILAQQRIVPEFMPGRPDPCAVARVARQLITDEQWRPLIPRPAASGPGSLGKTRPRPPALCLSARVCDLIAGLAGVAPPALL